MNLKIRDFEYTSSKYSYLTDNVDRITKGSRQDDISVVIFQAMQICTIRNYLNIDYIIIADDEFDKHTKYNNFVKKIIDAFCYNRWNSKKPKLLNILPYIYKSYKINNSIAKYIKSYISKLPMNYELTKDHSIDDLVKKHLHLIETKKQLHAFLPRNIQKLIISCRNSKNGVKCKQCFKCFIEKFYI